MPTVGLERGRQIDLVGRHLKHVSAARRERLERKHRHADIAAHLRVAAGAVDQMRGERGGGRFAVGAGDGDQRTTGAGFGALAAEQFDVADGFDAIAARQRRRPMRLGVRQRHAGGEDQGGDCRPVEVVQILRLEAGALRVGQHLLVVVEHHDVGAAGNQRAGGQQPRFTEAEDRDPSPGESGDGDHLIPSSRPSEARAGTHTPQSIDSARRMGPRFRGDDTSAHLNFKLASPASASTTATIQNRITICGSVQPICS